MTTLARHEPEPKTKALHAPEPTAIAVKPIDIGALLEACKGDPVAVEKLCDLALKLEANAARKAFFAAFADMQAELPPIIARRAVMDKGTTRYKFASLDDIMAQITPTLRKHGFGISFDSKMTDTGVTAYCILSFGGHREPREMSVHRSAPPGTSPAQADGATITYAKRYALCNALNLQIDEDDDARVQGDFVTEEQAINLEERIRALDSDPAAFLALAEAPEFSKVRSAKYGVLLNLIKSKERSRAKTGGN